MRSLYTMLMALLLVASSATYAQTVNESNRASKHSPTEQESLALAAMEGLMSQSPERALPIIRKVLAGSQTTLVKKRALFVLSQIDSPEADDILLQTARSADKALRSEAIRSIGIGGHDKSLAALQDVYNAGDADLKKQVLHAWMIAGRKAEVYQAALSAKSDDEAGEAIHMLSVMGAVDELRKLGDRPNASGKLVEAYAISGDLQSLRKIADSGADPSVRAEAVRKIGIIDSDASRTALRDIYARSNDKEIKEAALQGMLIAGDDQGVLALYKGATSIEEKRTLLRTLTMMDSDAALKAIDSALEDKQ
ncbi:MAG TPA: HEAT repeat domain-containing protein [Steroidobacteraceae bacterium]|jgi:HEAT repeat protein|nr:HEAT repeat domain-containing protein [Steroidobacteraceae bacterium]